MTEALQGVDRNNILPVRINSADKILAGTTVIIDDQHLLDLSKEFIRDRAPKAILTLQMDRGSSYSTYYDVQRLLKQTYDEVRDEQARSQYGKPLAELTRDELETVWMAFPLNIAEAESTNRPQSRVR